MSVQNVKDNMDKLVVLIKNLSADINSLAREEDSTTTKYVLENISSRLNGEIRIEAQNVLLVLNNILDEEAE